MSSETLLMDTGPLVALVNRRDRHHHWVRDELGDFRGELLTCEAVLSESWFLAQSRISQPERFLELLERLPLNVTQAWGPKVLELLRSYADQPMDVADACLVALVEARGGRSVMTIDVGGFSICRIHGQEPVPTLTPPD